MTRKPYSLAYAPLLLALLGPALAADAPLQLSFSLGVAEMAGTPQVLTLSLYDHAEAGDPLLVQDFGSGEFQTERLAGGAAVAVRLSLDATAIEPGIPLWGELAVDGIAVGKRIQVRAPGDPNISVEGLIESRSPTSGGFKFPDGSIQTGAVDASCAAGSSIRSLAPDGSFTCETDDIGGGGGSGTVTSITAGVGLTGGTITTSGTIAVASGGIDADMVASNAIGASELANDAVDTAAIQDANITTAKLADANVTSDKLADGAVTSAKVDSSQVQRRVTGSCELGQTITAIQADGSVTCGFGATFFSDRPNFASTVDDPANNVGSSTPIAIGADGLPVISYLDSTVFALKVAKCNDAACSGGDETLSTVDAPVNDVGLDSSIAIGADGLPVISYFDFSAIALKVAKCRDIACASGNAIITTVDDPANGVGVDTSIAIGADGRPVISYRDINAGALKVAKCNDAACSGGNETISTVDDPANAGVGSFTSIAIGVDGLPVISHYDNTAGALKVAKCNDAACSGANETISTVDDPANDVGEFTSIAIGADGLPVISYYDNTADALKVAKCNDAACSGANETISTVDDPANDVGQYTSIAIGADGLPVISYYDNTADTLKVTKCNDAACSGGNETITTVDDPANLVGEVTSIAIGADGLPVISYFDTTADALKVLKCGKPACN